MLPPGYNASNSDPVICHVGNTRTVLFIRLHDHRPLEPVAMAVTINAAKSYVDRKMKDGDGWLPHSSRFFSLRFLILPHVTSSMSKCLMKSSRMF